MGGREGGWEGTPLTLFASAIMMILKQTHFLFGTFLPSFYPFFFFFFRIILFCPINFWVSPLTYLLYCSVYRIINCQIILAKESFCSLLCFSHPLFSPFISSLLWTFLFLEQPFWFLFVKLTEDHWWWLWGNLNFNGSNLSVSGVLMLIISLCTQAFDISYRLKKKDRTQYIRPCFLWGFL